MAVLQGRTRAQLRQSIGYNLGAITVGTAYDAGSTTTLIDAIRFEGGDDNYNGKYDTRKSFLKNFFTLNFIPR